MPSANSSNSSESTASEIKIETPNAFGLSIIRIRDADQYREGIVDSKRTNLIEPRSNTLINDLTDQLALVQIDRKFLFVPLDQGAVSSEELDEVAGFRYAEPFRCGLALVILEDEWFYLNTEFEHAFGLNFDFAESFHNDRALVQANEKFRIIDTNGATVADLDYDQVKLQSPWCWQVMRKQDGTFYHGFVGLNGEPLTQLSFDEVGYYDPDVKRIRVGQKNRYGFLDEHAKEVIPIQYEYASVFDHGKARVRLNGREFYIGPDGQTVPE